ncbi:MAG TPA: serine hydrolase [Brumimicrobium sp.]|nr:serine hydrolase [Brumimicrobium sp.]
MYKKLYTFFVAIIVSSYVDGQSLYFPPTVENIWDTLSPQSLNWCPTKIDSLYAYLDNNNTKAFIVLKDGKIVLEKYFGTHTQTTPWQWASAGKTITSFLVGIAQQENELTISDASSNYLGQDWTSCTPAQEEQITIRHQLTMTSGLNDGVPDHFCTLDTCLLYEADAGIRWAYHNAPYTLLGEVLESATGMTINSYATQKLKNPIGMTGLFVPIGYNNVFFSNARSMARFGLLMLNKGNWNGTQIMTDTAYFNQMINSSQTLNPAYGYLWWLNGKSSYLLPGTQFEFNGFVNPHAPADMYAGIGMGGQFLNVIPSQNLVLVRMGEEPENLNVPHLMNDEIWKYINDLDCNSTTGLNEQSLENNFVRVFPNPSNEILHIQSNSIILKVELLNLHGQRVKTEHPQQKEWSFSVSELPNGFYFVKTRLYNGDTQIEKLIKE